MGITDSHDTVLKHAWHAVWAPRCSTREYGWRVAIYVAVFDPNAIYSDALTINATMSQLHLVIGHGTHVKWSHISAHILGCATLA